MLNIRNVAVIGANGTMGSLVAGLVAAFGKAKVFLVCRKLDAALKAIDTAANSVKADAIRSQLVPKTYEDFEDCISQSDWVFESVAENTQIKSEIYKRMGKCVRPGTIISTGTSGFSVSGLSEQLAAQARPFFFGTHFFNPPYSMTLCEMVRPDGINAKAYAQMQQYIVDVLHRDLIEVADTPAFLGNRIGFHFLNRALQYAVKYRKEGGIDYIDAVLGPFTGRGMTPIATVDFVGLDVHKAIVDNIGQNTSDYDNAAFELPEFVSKLVSEGKLGMKAGDGLFKLIEDADSPKKKKPLVYDVDSGFLRPVRRYDLPFARRMVAFLRAGDYEGAFASLKSETSKEAMLCKHFLASYITYGIATAHDVSPRIGDADVAMSAGFNWVGPVALMEAWGGYDETLKVARDVDFDNNLAEQLGKIKGMTRGFGPRLFDYRKFFRAVL